MSAGYQTGEDTQIIKSTSELKRLSSACVGFQFLFNTNYYSLLGAKLE
ncbi:hypothetical protein [Helicobacter pylori]|nr:hypothetical protein [Helicobacter pylori]WQS14317.1 hypothetical protein KVD76_00060 [Helicobacter pylori]WQS24056.1 hypothetical protein KVD61_00060 [Helicobacter pylori]